MIARGRNGFIGDICPKHSVNELDLDVAQRRLQRDSIATVSARGQANDENIFKLQLPAVNIKFKAPAGRLLSR